MMGIMNEIDKGQSNVDAKKKELNEAETKVKRLVGETDRFVMD